MNHPHLASVLALLLTGVGCSSSTPSGACRVNTDCPGGSICQGGECAQLCVTDSDCGSGKICRSQVCVAGIRTDLPVIDSVDGNGIADTIAGHTAHRTAGRLVISGQNLEGAAATLSGGAGPWTLRVCATTPDQMIVELPVALVAGSYTLTVASQAGACDTTLPVLQGEPGATGPEGPAGPAGPPPEVDLSGGNNGTNLLPNPHFVKRTGDVPEHWILATVGAGNAPTLVDVAWDAGSSSSAPAGPLAMRNGTNTRLELISAARVQLDQNVKYRVQGTFRQVPNAGSGSIGNVVLGVRLFGGDGAELSGSGPTGWWFEVANFQPPETWSQREGVIGVGTSVPFPAAARTMTVAVMLNRDSATGGNKVQEVQGLSLSADTHARVTPWFLAAGGDVWVSAAAGTWTYVTNLDQVRGSAAASYNVAQGRFTAPEAGLYHCYVKPYKSYSAAGYHHTISTCFAPGDATTERVCNGFSTWDYTLGGTDGTAHQDSTGMNQGYFFLQRDEQLAWRLYTQVANTNVYYRGHTRSGCVKLSD